MKEAALPKDKIQGLQDCLEFRADARMNLQASASIQPTGKGERHEAGKVLAVVLELRGKPCWFWQRLFLLLEHHRHAEYNTSSAQD